MRHYRHLPRYRQIAQVLIRHGFGELLAQMELLCLPRRLLRGREPEAGDAPVRVRLALEELGPTFVKLGQILSTRPDLLPPAYIAELSKLQDTVPPAPREEVMPLIERELGAPLDTLFATFDPEPIAAASLAQVHAATLPGGDEVVVKVQRPGIRPIIEVDLEILRDLARPAQERTSLGQLCDLAEIVEEFAFTLRNELNYRREGLNADRFRLNFAQEPYLYIPRVYWGYTTEQVLTLERISGIKIDDIAALDAAEYDRHHIALNAARIIIKEVLVDGFFHADPHPGNFVVMPGHIIGAMDFGMVGHLSRRLKENLVRLYIVSVSLDSEGIVDQLIRMGATQRRVDREHLRRDLERLLTKYRGLPLKQIRAREVVEEVMPMVYRHHLQLPSNLWLLGKTLAMMEGIGLQLDPDFDVFAVSQPYVRHFLWQMYSPTVLGRRLVTGVSDWSDLLRGLPQMVPRLLDQAERGDMQIRVDIPQTNSFLSQVDGIANRLAISLLTAAFIVALALLIPTLHLVQPSRLTTVMVVCGFVVVTLLGLWLLLSVWRSGRR